MIEVFLTPHYLAIVLEYAPGGDLLDYVTSKVHLVLLACGKQGSGLLLASGVPSC